MAVRSLVHKPDKRGIPRLNDDKGYYRGLGCLAARELHGVTSRTGLGLQEIQEAYSKYQRRSTREYRDAIKLALDPSGKRRIDPTEWISFRAPEGVLLLERKRFGTGIVLVYDQTTVRILERLMPGMLQVEWMEERARQSWQETGLPDGLAKFARELEGLGGEATSYEIAQAIDQQPSKLLAKYKKTWGDWIQKNIAQPRRGVWKLLH